jgi:hypothetical protein
MSFAVAGPEETKNLAGKSPPPDSDPFSDAEFGKISSGCQASSRQLANRRFEFHKRSQLLFGVHNQTLSVVAQGGFLEGSALGPFVKVDALTRERFCITRNTSWRTILVRAHDFR